MKIHKYDRFEIELKGPSSGNPFTEVSLQASFSDGHKTVVADGFYDGDGRYLVRFMPDREGQWKFITKSNVAGLDGVSGSFACIAARAGQHGPVRVQNQFHFTYDDGTPYYPFGTTAYNWTNQAVETVDQTLATLAKTGFNKIRFGPFPKHYLYNANEPLLYPFAGGQKDPSYVAPIDMASVFSGTMPDAYSFDFTRPNPAFFRDFERRVGQLGELGIEADIILFHPYDRWGFSKMPQEANLFYLRYIIARLASYPNVWWSMANEWDLLRHRSVEQWEELALTVQQHDPVGHLRSIHNCMKVYDQTSSWITHVSWQRIDVHSHVELTNKMREQWHKPVVIDEIAYEGNIDQGWGNITGEELTRRFWETVVRGGYCTHGETYYRPDELLWWAKGGELTGESPARIAFLRKILEKMGPITPVSRPMDWDLVWALAGNEYERTIESPFGAMPVRFADQMLCYFGFMRPSFRNFLLPADVQYQATLIDTWQMTETVLPGTCSGTVRLQLPGRTGMAVRFCKVKGEG